MRINVHLAIQLVSSKLGQDHSPDDPIDRSGEQNRDTDKTVQVIWDILVDALSLIRRHERRDNEVDIRQQEEDDDRQRGAEGRRPGGSVRGGGVKVQVHKGASDEDVDDGEGVRDDV